MSDLVYRAKHFATQAHERIGHRRKYTQHSYDVHLREVARLVAEVTEDEEIVAAAWLHDTVEDTPATVQDIEEAFGPGVARLVAELTDVSRPGDGNRAARKAIDRHQLARASARAKTVKLADLVDNCKDITGHDPRFAPVFLAEMGALLGVLGEGDAQLMELARKTHARCSTRLGLGPTTVAEIPPETPAEQASLDQGQRHVARLFVETFTARDIATPLRSFDGERDTGEVLATMQRLDLSVAGIRFDGTVGGYLRRDDAPGGTCAAAARAFFPGEVVPAGASLSDVILVLTRHEHCFVTLLGEVSGVLRRSDINRPVVRMWLFGIVTIIEMSLTQEIRARYPDDAWQALLPEGRLAKALALHEERTRRNLHCTLLDCLQLPDKALVLIQDGSLMALMNLESRRSAKRAAKEVESLRNHLAHAQDITTHDWAQIARLAHRVEEIARLTQVAPVGLGSSRAPVPWNPGAEDAV